MSRFMLWFNIFTSKITQTIKIKALTMFNRKNDNSNYPHIAKGITPSHTLPASVPTATSPQSNSGFSTSAAPAINPVKAVRSAKRGSNTNDPAPSKQAKTSESMTPNTNAISPNFGTKPSSYFQDEFEKTTFDQTIIKCIDIYKLNDVLANRELKWKSPTIDNYLPEEIVEIGGIKYKLADERVGKIFCTTFLYINKEKAQKFLAPQSSWKNKLYESPLIIAVFDHAIREGWNDIAFDIIEKSTFFKRWLNEEVTINFTIYREYILNDIAKINDTKIFLGVSKILKPDELRKWIVNIGGYFCLHEHMPYLENNVRAFASQTDLYLLKNLREEIKGRYNPPNNTIKIIGEYCDRLPNIAKTFFYDIRSTTLLPNAYTLAEQATVATSSSSSGASAAGSNTTTSAVGTAREATTYTSSSLSSLPPLLPPPIQYQAPTQQSPITTTGLFANSNVNAAATGSNTDINGQTQLQQTRQQSSDSASSAQRNSVSSLPFFNNGNNDNSAYRSIYERTPYPNDPLDF